MKVQTLLLAAILLSPRESFSQDATLTLPDPGKPTPLMPLTPSRGAGPNADAREHVSVEYPNVVYQERLGKNGGLIWAEATIEIRTFGPYFIVALEPIAQSLRENVDPHITAESIASQLLRGDSIAGMPTAMFYVTDAYDVDIWLQGVSSHEMNDRYPKWQIHGGTVLQGARKLNDKRNGYAPTTLSLRIMTSKIRRGNMVPIKDARIQQVMRAIARTFTVVLQAYWETAHTRDPSLAQNE